MWHGMDTGGAAAVTAEPALLPLLLRLTALSAETDRQSDGVEWLYCTAVRAALRRSLHAQW